MYFLRFSGVSVPVFSLNRTEVLGQKKKQAQHSPVVRAQWRLAGSARSIPGWTAVPHSFFLNKMLQGSSHLGPFKKKN
jgi:hypothetical protein